MSSFKEKLLKKYNTTFQDEFSEEIWRTTYKDYKDETINDTLYRVAEKIASAEETEELRKEWTEKFYDMLSEFKCTAGGRIYSNAGTEWDQDCTYANCFVAPRQNYDIDSLPEILEDLKRQSLTLKSEGGWGQNFCFGFEEMINICRGNEKLLIRIGDVQAGDFVYSSDKELHLVEETMTSYKENMVEILLSNGEVLKCTDDHPFLVIRDGEEVWIEVRYITEDDELVVA